MAKWIQKATQNRGGLHRSLGVPEGQKIPPSMVAKAASKGGKVGKQARLAETLGNMHHGSGHSSNVHHTVNVHIHSGKKKFSI